MTTTQKMVKIKIMSLSKIIESNKIVGLEEVDEAEVEAIA